MDGCPSPCRAALNAGAPGGAPEGTTEPAASSHGLGLRGPARERPGARPAEFMGVKFEPRAIRDVHRRPERS